MCMSLYYYNYYGMACDMLSYVWTALSVIHSIGSDLMINKFQTKDNILCRAMTFHYLYIEWVGIVSSKFSPRSCFNRDENR